jgi:hypothetical protein
MNASTSIDAQARAELMAYVKQQADNGGYAARLADVLIANANNSTRARRQRTDISANPYRLGASQIEALQMAYAFGSVGCGQGMGYAIERLHALKLIERMSNGFYRLTDKGRKVARELGYGADQ